MSATVYTTKRDVLDRMILPALGEYAAEHDVDAIADEITTYDAERGGFVETVGVDEFWAIVETHAL